MAKVGPIGLVGSMEAAQSHEDTRGHVDLEYLRSVVRARDVEVASLRHALAHAQTDARAWEQRALQAEATVGQMQKVVDDLTSSANQLLAASESD